MVVVGDIQLALPACSITIGVVVVVPSRAMVAVQWKCSGKPSGSPSVRVNHANRNDIVSLAFPAWFLGREHALKDRLDRMWCEILNDAAFYMCIRCRGHVRSVDTVVMERFHVRGWGRALLHARRGARTRFAKSTSSAPPYPARQSRPA